MPGTFSSRPVFVVLVAATVASTDVFASALADEVVTDNMPALAETGPVTLRQSSAEALKREYLKCDRAAGEIRLDMTSAARCSLVYEELRDRVFNGDFNALLAWWRETR